MVSVVRFAEQIVVEGVSLDEYISWVSNKMEEI